MRSVEALLLQRSKLFLDFNYMAPFLAVYGEHCNIDTAFLRAEMTVASNLVKNTIQPSDKNCLQNILQLIPNGAFPNLNKCMKIALTIPVTSASCERSFSAMKFVKNYLRNRTSDDVVCGQD